MTTLRSAVQEYLALRRGLGFKLHDAGTALLKFVAFMEQHRASSITTPLALAWAQQPPTVQPAEWARRLSIVRIFARYRYATDPRTEIPPDGLLPYRPKRITTHGLRHSSAMELLQAGVDRSVIALWLGHESVETTQIYLEATLAMKERALAKTTPLNGRFSRYRPADELLGFLNSL